MSIRDTSGTVCTSSRPRGYTRRKTNGIYNRISILRERVQILRTNWGSHQYVSLYEAVNNFMLMYSGIIVLLITRKVQVLFRKEAIQEPNYDAFKEIKILQLDVCDTPRFVLPPDFVNWVRVSIYKDGVLRPLTENIQTNYSSAYLQDNDCKILFDQDGNILKPEFQLRYG